MARIRSIHPKACDSRKLAKISSDAERLFWRLQTHCDDFGRCEDDPRMIWMRCCTHLTEWDQDLVERLLGELHEVGLIDRYEVDGDGFIEVGKWTTFQHPRKPTPSPFPGRDGMSAAPVRNESRTPPEPPRTGEGGEKEEEQEGNAPALTRTERNSLVAETVELLLLRDGTNDMAQTKSQPSRWLASARLGREKDHHDRAHELLVEHPAWTPAELAQALEPATEKPKPKSCPDCGEAGKEAGHEPCSMTLRAVS